MSDEKTTSLEGDVNISRRLIVGGKATVRGDTTFDHDVTVKGYLDADNLRVGGSTIQEIVGEETAAREEDTDTLSEKIATLEERAAALQKTADELASSLGNIDHAASADYATEAGEADHAASAYQLDTDSPDLQKFLSKIEDDVASGVITFAQGLISASAAVFRATIRAAGNAYLDGGATFGDFISSLYYGTGGAIDSKGNAEVESLKVRSAMYVAELIINRLSALEGDQILTEADTIESFEVNDDGTYDLYLRSKWDGYFTAQKEGNVLKGIMNTLAEGSGEYYTGWYRVNSVDTAANKIEVTMYEDEDTPAGANYPPEVGMKIARWGSQSDTTRQTCLYLSSTEGRIVYLINVTKPIIDETNYGATFGTVPDFVKTLTDADLDTGGYIYVKGVLAESFITVDYQGNPTATFVDRGEWVEGGDYYCNAFRTETKQYETSDVWYMGCKWRCAKTGTTTAPRWNNTDWAQIEGNPNFWVEFVELEQIYDPDNFNATLTLRAWIHNIDVTDDIDADDYEWTRYSEDADGNELAASDNVWALQHAGVGNSITLTMDDIPSGYSVVRFTCTATLRDGEVTVSDSAVLEV